MKDSTRGTPNPAQADLDLDAAETANVVPQTNAARRKRSREVIEPQQLELVLADALDVVPKDDIGSMGVPIFSLSKSGDSEVRIYQRGNRTVRIIPSGVGAATVFDKDLILYLASQIVDRINRNLPVSRTVQVDTYDFIKATARDDSRSGYEGILNLLRRLRGTTLETNIPTGGIVPDKGFSLIDEYEVVSKRKRKATVAEKKQGKGDQIDRPLTFTVTMSKWLYNGLLKLEVLTLHRQYFQLTKAIERTLYETARRHCGKDKALWKMEIDGLAEKIGFRRDRPKFRAELRQIIKDDTLPEYYLALDHSTRPGMVVFYTRDAAALSKYIRTEGCYDWFNALETKATLAAEAASDAA